MGDLLSREYATRCRPCQGHPLLTWRHRVAILSRSDTMTPLKGKRLTDEMLRAALQQHEWNVQRTAEALSIDRATIYRRLGSGNAALLRAAAGDVGAASDEANECARDASLTGDRQARTLPAVVATGTDSREEGGPRRLWRVALDMPKAKRKWVKHRVVEIGGSLSDVFNELVDLAIARDRDQAGRGESS